MELVHGELSLRPPTSADAAEIAAAVTASMAELAPWLPWATPGYDLATAAAWANGELGEEHRFVLVDGSGGIAGSCGLNHLDHENRRANLGYWVRTDRTGRGHAVAATRLVAGFGFDVAGMHRIEIVMSVRNLASRAVAERAGAHHEGVARGRLLLGGEFHDAHTFSLLPGDLHPR